MKRSLVWWTFLLLICDGCVALRNVTLEIADMLRADDARLTDILFEMMKSFMDANVDPCQNFHQYACGNFDSYNYITDGRREKNMMDLVKTYMQAALNASINTLPEVFAEQTNIPESDPRRKLWAYYQSCMDREFNVNHGPRRLLKLIQSIEAGLAFNETWQGPTSSLGVTLGKLKNLSYEVFIEADVYADLTEPTKNVLYLLEPENSFLRGYFNQCASYDDQIPYKVMSKVGRVVRYFNNNHSKISQLKADMVNFERQYRKIAKRSENRPPVYTQHEKLTIAELQEKLPDFDWIGYLRQFRGNDLNLEEKVIVVNMDYFKKLTQFLQRSVNTAISRVMIDFAEIYLDLLGVFGKKPMWDKCVEQASDLMTETVSHLFAKHVGFEHHPELVNMREDLRHKFADMIQNAWWIEQANKPTLLSKLQKLDLKAMGLPKNFLNPRVRRCKLHGVQIRRNFFMNTIKLKANFVRQEMEWIGKPLNDADMGESPTDLFAEHDYIKNKVSVGIGFLSPPFFHASFPAFYHFATLGYVISHEMAHAFDSVGMYFFGDKPNHLNPLYTDRTANKFNAILKCFRNEYRLAGVRAATTQETIPDSIGLKVAYETYKEWKKYHPYVTETIPGLNLTESQLFFLSFALPMCSQPILNGINNDPTVPHPYGNISSFNHDPKDSHPPQAVRLLGTLRLSEEFAKAFNCPVNSKMNPKEKCRVFD